MQTVGKKLQRQFPSIEFNPVPGRPTAFVLFARGRWSAEEFSEHAREELGAYGGRVVIDGIEQVSYEHWRPAPATLQMRAQTGLDRILRATRPGPGAFIVTRFVPYAIASDAGDVNIGGRQEVAHNARRALDQIRPTPQLQVSDTDTQIIVWTRTFIDADEFLEMCRRQQPGVLPMLQESEPQIRHEFWRPTQRPKRSRQAMARADSFIKAHGRGHGSFRTTSVIIDKPAMGHVSGDYSGDQDEPRRLQSSASGGAARAT